MGIPDNFLKQIFRSAPHPYLILHADKAYTISDANDCYLEATGIKREEVIGRGLFEVFPDDPNDTTASGVSDLHISLDRVLRCGKSDIMGVQKYDIPLRDGSGKFTVKYWSPVNTPIFGENGSVEFIIHSVEDVTEFMLLKQASGEESSTFKAARAVSSHTAKEKSEDVQPFVAEAQQWMHRSKPDAFKPLEESRGSVIVADDNRDMRDYVSRLLEDAGYSVKRASDGLEALRMCRESLPDLLFSDVMMPVLDGLSLLHTLRSDPQTATLPIILFSGLADEDFKTEALSAGADEYLIKPFHAAELLARVEGSVKLGRLRCRAEHFYHTVFSSVYEAIIILENNIVIDCNDMAATLFEMRKDELVGLDILSPAYHFECKGDSFYDYLASASHRGTTTMECSLSLEHHPNKIKVLEMILSNFATEENKQIVIARDITQKLEEEKRFKMQARQAQLGEMISMIAHQWRQPLAIINAIAAQMRLKELMKEKEDPQLIENLTKIEQQCVHLSQTISDFRDLSSPNKEKEYVSLPQLVDHAINLLDHTFKNSSVKVTKVPGVEIGVVTFYNDVLQVLITLLKNSVDACEENRIGNCTISVSVDQEDEYFTIRVHDNAGGIPADLINKLFTPYFTTKEGGNGTGLGLYMSKMIIEEHCRGLLEVSSEAQESTFTIKLPKSLPL